MSEPASVAPLVRRWYLVLMGMILTCVAAVVLSETVATTCTSSAAVVLVPGPRSIPKGDNPFLYMGNLIQARDVLVQTLSTEATTSEILDGTKDATVEATADRMTSGPVIMLTATAPTAVRVTALRDAALAALTQRLDSLQDRANTPVRARISALTLSEDDVPEVSSRQRLRLIIMIGVLGLALTLGLTAVIDRLLGKRGQRSEARRRRRTRERNQAQDDLTGDWAGDAGADLAAHDDDSVPLGVTSGTSDLDLAAAGRRGSAGN